jgi:hypothetical protein
MAMEYSDKRMNRNLGEGSTVTQPRSPARGLINPPAIRAGGLPQAIPQSTGFQLGGSSPIQVDSVSRPSSPRLALPAPEVRQNIDADVRQRLNRVTGNTANPNFVGPKMQSGGLPPQAEGGFVGPKNLGAFAPKMSFGGSQMVDQTGGILGELYRRWSNSNDMYIPLIDNAWGGENRDMWKEADTAFKQGRGGFKIHEKSDTKFPAISNPNNYPLVEDVFPQQRAEWDTKAEQPSVAQKPVAIPNGTMTVGGKQSHIYATPPEELAKQEESRLRNVALNDQREKEYQDSLRQEQLQREFRQGQDSQRNFDSNIGWALNNPNAPNAQATLMQLKQGRQVGAIPSLTNMQNDYNIKQAEMGYKGALGNQANAIAGQHNVESRLMPAMNEAKMRQMLAQDKHYGALDQLSGAQANQINAGMEIQQKALEGDPNALTLLGKQDRRTQAYMHAIQEANKITDEQARNEAIYNANMAYQGYEPRLKQAIPASGSLWWKTPEQKAALEWTPPPKKQG